MAAHGRNEKRLAARFAHKSHQSFYRKRLIGDAAAAHGDCHGLAGTDRVKQMFSMNLPGDLLRNVNRSGMYKMLSDFYHPRDFDAGEQTEMTIRTAI